MEAKLKAIELVDKMLNEQSYSEDLYDAKQCALIAVDEIIDLGLLYGNAPFGNGFFHYFNILSILLSLLL